MMKLRSDQSGMKYEVFREDPCINIQSRLSITPYFKILLNSLSRSIYTDLMKVKFGRKAVPEAEKSNKRKQDLLIFSWNILEDGSIEWAVWYLQIFCNKSHASMSTGSPVFHSLHFTLLNSQKNEEKD